ncbi:hypothetical protein D7322_07350 [Sphingobacterium puteale]|uniref:YokE-like PH domain-containing protein n=1 Tax=Sphingobacterium puteale TaxID=2420510 RepID=A0A420W1Z8_9SPHI|nr:hypothetical protein [Sphingobacterium puteale]RKO72602.1 hypothetical protein D7322_07350 [Sphingobacterium puteale]
MEEANLKARIKRNMLDILSGKSFRDETSEIIKHLNKSDANAFVGIQREDGIYTIIGAEKIYYMTPLMTKGDMPIGEFLSVLTKNAMTLGKTSTYEFVKISENNTVWVMNAETMNALWNTMLLLDCVSKSC